MNIKKQIELGLCTLCNNASKVGFTKCEYHLELKRLAHIRYRNKCKETDRCTRCGRQIVDTGLGGSKTKCVNCNEYKSIW